jgi:hypothetical protein
MPIFRIVYIDTDYVGDESLRPRTLTAAFADRAAAEAAMAKHGLRIAYIAEAGRDAGGSELATIPMAGDSPPQAPVPIPPAVGERNSVATLPRYDLAAWTVVVAGAAMVGAAFWLF